MPKPTTGSIPSPQPIDIINKQKVTGSVSGASKMKPVIRNKQTNTTPKEK